MSWFISFEVRVLGYEFVLFFSLIDSPLFLIALYSLRRLMDDLGRKKAHKTQDDRHKQQETKDNKVPTTLLQQ